MSFNKALKEAYGVLAWKPNAVKNVIKSESAVKYATFFVIITILLLRIILGSIQKTVNWSAVWMGVYSFLFFVVLVSLVHVCATKILKGKGVDTYKVGGYAYIVHILELIPYVGIIASVWYLITLGVNAKRIYNFSNGKSALAIILPMIILAIVIALLVIIMADQIANENVINVDLNNLKTN